MQEALVNALELKKTHMHSDLALYGSKEQGREMKC